AGTWRSSLKIVTSNVLPPRTFPPPASSTPVSPAPFGWSARVASPVVRIAYDAASLGNPARGVSATAFGVPLGAVTKDAPVTSRGVAAIADPSAAADELGLIDALAVEPA